MTILSHIERAFRHRVVYPLFRTILSNQDVPFPLDLTRVRRLLLLRTDRLGDMVVTSSLIGRIRERAPDVFLGMVVSHKNVEAAELVGGIDRLYVIGRTAGETLRSIRHARREGYDVVLNLVFNRTTLGGVLSNLIAPQGIKVGQGDPKYRFYFNAMVVLERGRHHMAEILESFGQQAFGASFSGTSLPYALNDDPEAARRVERFLEEIHGAPLVVNLSAGAPARSLRIEQARELIAAILPRVPNPIVVTAGPGDEAARAEVVTSLGDARVHAFPMDGRARFAELVALVRRSRFVITPDTSLVHLAGLAGTPLLGLYTDPFALAEWSPRNTIAEIVITENNQPLSTMPVARMVEGFDRLHRRISQG